MNEFFKMLSDNFYQTIGFLVVFLGGTVGLSMLVTYSNRWLGWRMDAKHVRKSERTNGGTPSLSTLALKVEHLEAKTDACSLKSKEDDDKRAERAQEYIRKNDSAHKEITLRLGKSNESMGELELSRAKDKVELLTKFQDGFDSLRSDIKNDFRGVHARIDRAFKGEG